MKQNTLPILVLDSQPYWRDFAAATLRAAGYSVSTLSLYQEALPPRDEEQDTFLVLLSCSKIERRERLLIACLLARGQHVIVFVSSLSTQDMRALFIRGVEDALDRTYSSEELVNVVEQALERIEMRKHTQFPVERKVSYE